MPRKTNRSRSRSRRSRRRSRRSRKNMRGGQPSEFIINYVNDTLGITPETVPLPITVVNNLIQRPENITNHDVKLLTASYLLNYDLNTEDEKEMWKFVESELNRIEKNLDNEDVVTDSLVLLRNYFEAIVSNEPQD